jgi:hypothetical protein
MGIDLKTALTHLPLPATPAWPEGVWDKPLFQHGTMSVLIFAAIATLSFGRWTFALRMKHGHHGSRYCTTSVIAGEVSAGLFLSPA